MALPPGCGVDTIEAALHKGRAHYQADGPLGADITAQQLEADKQGAVSLVPLVRQRAAATTASLAPTKFSMSSDMVKGLQADLKRMQQTQAGRQAP